MAGPTNNDLLREIKQVQHTQNDHGSRLASLETWRVAETAAKSAVTEYKKDQEKNREQQDKRRLVTNVASFLAVLTILIWAIIEYIARSH